MFASPITSMTKVAWIGGWISYHCMPLKTKYQSGQSALPVTTSQTACDQERSKGFLCYKVGWLGFFIILPLFSCLIPAPILLPPLCHHEKLRHRKILQCSTS